MSFYRTLQQSPFSKLWIAFMLLLLPLLLSPMQAEAANWWSPATGPNGGYVNIIAVDPITPTTLYMGSLAGGVYKSTATGDPVWTAMNTGLTSKAVTSLVIDPVNPTVLYAGTYGGGVFKSVDSGANWAAVNVGLTNLNIRTLVIDPNTPNTLYVGTGGAAADVFKSVDGGANWTAMNIITTATIWAIAIDPNTPSTVYAGTEGGVFKSLNGGATWQSSNRLLGNTQVRALILDPTTPSTIYIGTGGGSVGAGSFSGVYKSTDSGVTWLPSSTGLTTTNIQSLAIDSNTGALYAGTWDIGAGVAGIFKSVDGGMNWTTPFSIGYLYTPQPTAVLSIVIDSSSPGRLYMGTSSGPFKSVDSGTRWVQSDVGFINVDVLDIAIGLRHIYAATDSVGVKSIGLYNVTNNGQTNPLVSCIAIAPRAKATVFLGTPSGVLKSLDYGFTWYPINAGLRSKNVTSLAVDPIDSLTVYAGTSSGLFKSITGGLSWTLSDAGIVASPDIAIDPITPSVVYAATIGGGVFKSVDSGANWVSANTGITSSVQKITIDPLVPTTLYAATSGGVFKSIDGAASWTAMNNGLTTLSVTSMVIDPATPATLYVGTWGGGVFQSVDGGMNWVTMNAGLSNPIVVSLAIDPDSPDTLYTGVRYGGIQKMTSGFVTINSSIATSTKNTAVSLLYDCNQCATVEFSNDNVTWFGPFAAASTYAHTLAAGPDGVRTVYARATDAAGNVSSVVSDTIILDTIAPAVPVITLPVNNTVNNTPSGVTISGTASADTTTITIYEGFTPIASSAYLASNTNWSVTTFGLSEGVHNFTALALDAADNYSAKSSVLTYTVDSISPVFVGTPFADVAAEATGVNTFVTLTPPTATDASAVTINNNAPASGFPLGTTVVTWTATDAAGNTAIANQNVIVQDTTAPTLTLLGSSPYTLLAGQTYVDAGVSASDLVDGNITARVVVSNPVSNPAIEGVYSITYNVSDAAGHAATPLTRTVRVAAAGSTNNGSTVPLILAGSAGTVDIYSAGEVVFSALSTAALGTPPAGINFPFGVIDYYTSVGVVGGRKVVRSTFSTALPANAVVYKVDGAGNYSVLSTAIWKQVSANAIEVTLTDGDTLTDLDGAANGVIHDPLAIGAAVSATTVASTGGGGGCTLGTTAKFDPTFFILLFLSVVIVGRRCRKS